MLKHLRWSGAGCFQDLRNSGVVRKSRAHYTDFRVVWKMLTAAAGTAEGRVERHDREWRGEEEIVASG
jgi:hypothetical protein